MRLKVLEHGHSFKAKLLLGLMNVMSRGNVPDVVRTALYRPRFFIRHYGPWADTVMRGPSRWSVAERELFAAFVSHVNACPF